MSNVRAHANERRSPFTASLLPAHRSARAVRPSAASAPSAQRQDASRIGWSAPPCDGVALRWSSKVAQLGLVEQRSSPRFCTHWSVLEMRLPARKCFSSTSALTPSSSGRPPASFACLRPPLMSNVMPQLLIECLHRLTPFDRLPRLHQVPLPRFRSASSFKRRAVGNFAVPSQRLAVVQRSTSPSQKFFVSGNRHCAWLRSCASCSAMGTTARHLFAPGRLHNLSVKRTSSGWLRQPAAAAYLRR